MLSTSEGLIGVASLGLTAILLIVVGILAYKLRALRLAQSAVLGEQGNRDLVQAVADLQGSFDILQAETTNGVTLLDQRLSSVEEHLTRAVDRSGISRYDAYGEMSGRQSSSVVFLDSLGNGVVLSTIVHRDQARVYVKPIREGKGDPALSPEEQQAVDQANSSATA